MNIGNIAFKIYGALILTPFILGVLYWGAAEGLTFIQNQPHNFRDKVEVGGIVASYKGRRAYTPTLRLPGQDTNGDAKVELRRNASIYLQYEDLTQLPLDGRIMVKDSEGKVKEHDEGAKYDKKTLEEIKKLRESLGIVNSDGISLREIVEAEIQEAIAKR